MSRILKYFFFAACIVVLVSIPVFVFSSMQSDIFDLREIQISLENSHTNFLTDPIQKIEILEISDLEVGRDNLYQLSMDAVSARIEAHPWIRRVELKKRMPGTLKIEVHLREPFATTADAQGNLFFIDESGVRIDRFRSGLSRPVPHIGASWIERDPGLPRAKALLLAWKTAVDRDPRGQLLAIDGLDWFIPTMLQVSARYRGTRGIVRLPIDLRQDFDNRFEEIVPRIHKTLYYLAEKSIQARRLLVTSAKKIVVKTTPSS